VDNVSDLYLLPMSGPLVQCLGLAIGGKCVVQYTTSLGFAMVRG
jgi:hypothetical protein